MKESYKIRVYVGTLLVVLLLILPSLHSRVHAFHNEPDGFQGIKWGTNIKELADMVLDEDGGYSKLYRRQRAMQLRSVLPSLKGCSYIFYQDMFYGVFIEFTSSSNARAIKNSSRSHGEGALLQPGKLIEAYQWSGAW